MPEAWELRKKGYPTPANASTQERFRTRDSMQRCQIGKGAVRPKFHETRKGILLIFEGIARNSPRGY
jgi:hypothetical protein